MSVDASGRALPTHGGVAMLTVLTRYIFFFFGFPFRKPAFCWAFRVLCLRRSLRN
jgi:hypothetical protein